MIEDYEITPESSRNVLLLRVGEDINNKKIAIIFQHVSWEQALDLYIAESAIQRDKMIQECPVSDFVMDMELARELHAQLGEIIHKFEGDEQS